MGDVRHDEKRARYELVIDGKTAVASYARTGEVLTFTRTEVPGSLRGRGVGSRLIAGAFVDVRRHGWRVRPACSFVAAYAELHPEIQDLLVEM